MCVSRTRERIGRMFIAPSAFGLGSFGLGILDILDDYLSCKSARMAVRGDIIYASSSDLASLVIILLFSFLPPSSFLPYPLGVLPPPSFLIYRSSDGNIPT